MREKTGLRSWFEANWNEGFFVLGASEANASRCGDGVKFFFVLLLHFLVFCS